MLSSDNYKKYSKYISAPQELREVKLLYHALDALYTKMPDSNFNVDDLETQVCASYPNMRSVEREAIGDLCAQLRGVEVKNEVISSLLRETSARQKARAIAILGFEVSEGKRAPEELTALAESLKADTVTDGPLYANSRNFVTDDLYELEKHTIKSKGLRWRLACLSRSLGPIRPGDFGFVFARPESGKTTFLADQVTYFCEQAEKPCVWFNNEEQGEKVRLRTYQATLGITQDEIWKQKDKILALYRQRTKGLLKIYDDASIHKKEVEAIVAEIGPTLIIFDQIDKIKGFDADRPDLVYGRIYQWARELAKRGCAVIGICQADGTGEGVKWLTMGHVAEAKTSKQAEADWILGIGRSNETGTDDIRYLNISKNKLLGDESTDPNLRHGRFEVFMRPQIARYEDLE